MPGLISNQLKAMLVVEDITEIVLNLKKLAIVSMIILRKKLTSMRKVLLRSLPQILPSIQMWKYYENS